MGVLRTVRDALGVNLVVSEDSMIDCGPRMPQV